MAGKPQKNLAYSVLLDFYGPALTEKQRAILTEYYDEDLSLAEIAENFGITRQGVRDAIKHGEAALDELEAQLGNARRHAQMQEDLARLHQLVMEVNVEAAVLVLGETSTFQVSSQIVVAETVIVGEVPNTFIQTGEEASRLFQ